MIRLVRKIRRTFNIFTGIDPKHFVQVKRKYLVLGNYGADWAIIPNLKKESIVYSFGIGEDISFDRELIKKFGLTVFAFDPTPRSIRWLKSQKLPKNFKVYPWGIADFNGKAVFVPPKNPKHVSFRIIKSKVKSETNPLEVYTLKVIMKKLKHSKIDLLKMDVEGTEYSVIKNILREKILAPQLLIEFHHRFPEYEKSHTENTIKLLNTYGYKIFYISDAGSEYSLCL